VNGAAWKDDRVVRPCRRDGAGRTIKVNREEVAMKASKGDRIVIRGHRIGEPNRDCEVLDVRGVDGAPPYLVRWEDSAQETLFFPGSDAAVEHYDHAES
jgi:hypothetical protein